MVMLLSGMRLVARGSKECSCRSLGPGGGLAPGDRQTVCVGRRENHPSVGRSQGTQDPGGCRGGLRPKPSNPLSPSYIMFVAVHIRNTRLVPGVLEASLIYPT